MCKEKSVTVRIMLFNHGEFMRVCSLQILTPGCFWKDCLVLHERGENSRGEEVDDDG